MSPRADSIDVLVVRQQQLGEVLLLGLGRQNGKKTLKGMSGMTEVTPADRSCWTTKGACGSVEAVSEGSAAIVFTTGVMPARSRSGSRYW